MDLLVFASGFFLDPGKIYGYILILIFILFYLIKPKPKYQVLPTLMFLFKDMGRSKSTNFFRQLITNMLFLLQLLLLLSLITAGAKPYLNVSKEALFKNTVVVLDVSASMGAPYDGKTRLDEAVKIAKDNLGSVNTLILVKRTPQPVLIDESAGKVRDYISKLKPTGTPTNLYSAITLAGTYAKADSRVVVISDFIDTTTDANFATVKRTLESQGIKVDYFDIMSKSPNVGIVELSVTDAKTTAVVKNFNPAPVEAQMSINDYSETLTIAPGSREVFTFTTPPGTSKVELKAPASSDSFKEDNVAYISAPSDVKKKVLLITNNADHTRTYIYNAFDVMKSAQVEVAIPPKIPDLGKYDVYILKDVNVNFILPGTFKDIKEEVEKRGKAAIIMAQSGMLAVDYQGLMQTVPESLSEATTNIIPAGTESLTSGIEFGITKRHYTMKAVEGKPIVPITESIDGDPLIYYSKLGQGYMLYYGIMDEDRDSEAFFAKSPSYFVFWKRSLDLITNTASVNSLNFRTGSVIEFADERTITTPQGKIKTDKLSLDNQGLYTLEDRIIAINLADERESDISSEQAITDEELAKGSERFKEKVPFELTDYLAYLGILLLFLELAYIKMRGDF